MGFFLVGRSREDGSLSLISPQEFDTRASAVDALQSLQVDASLESEVYVSDLDAATPVLLVQRGPAESASAPPVPEPATEPTAAEETAPEVAPEEESEPLADVLRRATGSLESEGIVAPENVGPVAEPAPAAEVASGADASWPWDSAGGVKEAEEPTAAEPAEVEDAPAVEVAPAVEETPAVEDAPAAEEPPTAYVPDPLEEPAVDDGGSGLVFAKGDDDTVGLSRTVVMGAYSNDAPVSEVPAVEQEASVPEVAVAEPTVPEVEAPAPAEPEPTPDPETSSLIADLEIPPDLPEAPAADTPVPEPSDEGVPAVIEAPAAPSPLDDAPEYQAGDVDLSTLTCEDCVYVNTCPNKDERDPASCGSFQWKSS